MSVSPGHLPLLSQIPLKSSAAPTVGQIWTETRYGGVSAQKGAPDQAERGTWCALTTSLAGELAKDAATPLGHDFRETNWETKQKPTSLPGVAWDLGSLPVFSSFQKSKWEASLSISQASCGAMRGLLHKELAGRTREPRRLPPSCLRNIDAFK